MEPVVNEEVLELLLSQFETSHSRLTSNQRQQLIDQLPRLTEQQIVSKGCRDASCPICFTPFLALLAEEEMALAMDSPAQNPDDLGVTQLSHIGQCGHLFCRKDISKWIYGGHDTCPLCRSPFLSTSAATTPSSPTNLQHDNLTDAGRDPYMLFLARFSPLRPRIIQEEADENNDRNQFTSNGMYS